MADIKPQKPRPQGEQQPPADQSSSQRMENLKNTPVARRYWPATSDVLFESPFSLMRRMTEEMDRLLGATPILGKDIEPGSWWPVVEVTRENDKVVVCAELPGMNKEDVHVEASEGALILEGEKKRERDAGEGEFLRSERSYGRFYRLIPLPEGAEVDKAQAQFKDGVLTVEIPAAETKDRGRQIPIS
jgi:HSP20 family protein